MKRKCSFATSATSATVMHLFRPSGILGLNARNLLYIKPFNSRKAIAFADDKLKTKMFLGSRGIPVAKVYARLETRRQVRALDLHALPDECVLKPNEGYGGEGIIVLKGRQNGAYLRNGKDTISDRDLCNHMEDILEGKYSLSGHRDIAFFEQILVAHDAFARFRPAGLPDIRIIVFNLVPVMAMLRIPTAQSGGKANVHLGGIGIGIDIAKGVTTHATQYNRLIKTLPHGGSPAGIAIPFWDEILLISSRIQQITNLGYIAVDITIDRDLGPTLLEVNARAGLMVQVANLAPLRGRLERVEGLKVGSPEKGVRIGQELFGERIARAETEQAHPVLGTRESVSIMGESDSVECPARIEPDRKQSACTPEFLAELEGAGMATRVKTSGMYRIKLAIGEKKLQTIVASEALTGPERIVIGQRDLSGFLIDPLRTQKPRTAPRVRRDLRAIDSLLAEAETALPLLKLIKPINLLEERKLVEQDTSYEPVFRYTPAPDDLEDIERRIAEPIRDTSPIGTLLERKRLNVLQRVALLRSRGDSAAFTAASRAFFGPTHPQVLKRAHTEIGAETSSTEEAKTYETEEARELLEDALERCGLHDWKCSIQASLVADCSVGGKTVALREGARFGATHVAALIAHEIEVHAITAENGDHQPWLLLRRGTAGYIATQEGLAVWSQNRVLPAGHPKRLGPIRSLLAVEFARSHGFRDTLHYLEGTLGYNREKAIGKCLDIKRGIGDTSAPGAFTKGSVYLHGLDAVEEFVRHGGDLRRLFIGKVTLEDLELIEQIPDLEPALLLPEWLRE